MEFSNNSPSDSLNKISCFYINATRKIQIIRIKDVRMYLERVAFPGQRIIFEAMSENRLEISTHENATAIVADLIPCYQLRIIDDPILTNLAVSPILLETTA